MQAILRRSDPAPVPRSPREAAGSMFAAVRRRIARTFAKLAERPPGPRREPPPELFRYPLP